MEKTPEERLADLERAMIAQFSMNDGAIEADLQREARELAQESILKELATALGSNHNRVKFALDERTDWWVYHLRRKYGLIHPEPPSEVEPLPQWQPIFDPPGGQSPIE